VNKKSKTKTAEKRIGNLHKKIEKGESGPKKRSETPLSEIERNLGKDHEGVTSRATIVANQGVFGGASKITIWGDQREIRDLQGGGHEQFQPGPYRRGLTIVEEKRKINSRKRNEAQQDHESKREGFSDLPNKGQGGRQGATKREATRKKTL